MERKLKSNAGLTLLELMFASGVLALALSLLFGSLLSINVIGQLSEERTRAASQLAGILEELREMDLEGVVTYVPPDLKSPGVEQALSLTYFAGDGTEVALPLPEGSEVPEDLPNPLQLRAELVWSDEQGRLYSMDAVTAHGR